MVDAAATADEGERREMMGKLTLTLYPKIKGGCPSCGDSLDQEELLVSDHGRRYNIFVVWCEDCKQIVGYIRPTPHSLKHKEEKRFYDFNELDYQLVQLVVIEQTNIDEQFNGV